jgi:uncharacterized ferredoxin-like protein
MAGDARQEEIQAAQEIVHAAVVEARRLAAERGLDDRMILGIAATRLEAFAFWAAMTQTKPEDFFKKEVRIVRLGQNANPS